MSEGGVITRAIRKIPLRASLWADDRPPLALRVGSPVSPVAEYFRDQEHLDVLLFIGQHFSFRASRFRSFALLGRMPSAVGYQPTLKHGIGELQERITSTSPVRSLRLSDLRSCDDYTDPAPLPRFTHLDATTNLSRQIVERGIYPAVDPLASYSRILIRESLRGPLRCARSVKSILARYKDLQDIIAILGIEELSDDDSAQ